MKKVFCAFAMSCALAVGMSMPAFAADSKPAQSGDNIVPLTTIMSSTPLTLQAEVPLSIPFSIQNVKAQTVSSDAILPNAGSIQIINRSAGDLKMNAAYITAGSDNSNLTVWGLQNHSVEFNKNIDSLSFEIGIHNDANESFTKYAINKDSQFDGVSGLYLMSQAQYKNFPTPMPTENAFNIDVQKASVYLASPDRMNKINGLEQNLFNIVFTLSV